MQIHIISVVPELLDSFFTHSILKRATQKGLLSVQLHNLRQWAVNKHGQVDDYQYGGGAGMVMQCQPLANAIKDLQTQFGNFDAVIYTTPDGKTFNQATANRLSMLQNILIICGHYKGVDQRIRDKYVTNEISVGDYVLSGGEIPAAVIVDSIGRLIPGVLNDETSALTDSFQDNLLAPPVYTRPEIFEDMPVPKVLLSGNTKFIEDWRYEQALTKTKLLRPDLLHE